MHSHQLLRGNSPLTPTPLPTTTSSCAALLMQDQSSPIVTHSHAGGGGALDKPSTSHHAALHLSGVVTRSHSKDNNPPIKLFSDALKFRISKGLKSDDEPIASRTRSHQQAQHNTDSSESDASESDGSMPPRPKAKKTKWTVLSSVSSLSAGPVGNLRNMNSGHSSPTEQLQADDISTPLSHKTPPPRQCSSSGGKGRGGECNPMKARKSCLKQAFH